MNENEKCSIRKRQGKVRPAKDDGLSRREFIKGSAAVSLGALAYSTNYVYAAGDDKIRVGLIGCGGRGTVDTTDCLKSSANVELVAMGDLFKDRLDSSLEKLKENMSGENKSEENLQEKKLSEKINVTKDRCFVGFDAYKKVLACDLDMVILTTPPHFRPEHFKAAVEANKHVFMEKPVAIDPVGVRSVIASSGTAERKGLSIVAGTQMRRIAHLVAVMKRIHRGDIGEILAGQCVRNSGGTLGWGPKRKAEWSGMEWQLRRWYFFNWLSGDFIVESSVHNLDIVNWGLGTHPIKAMGIGGREVLAGVEYGNTYDHMAVEYEYPNGVRIAYMGRQIEGCSNRNDIRFVGTKGSAYMDFGDAVITGENPFEYDGPTYNPCIRQHADLIASIREGKPINEGRQIAESTLTSIMGRMSVYTGRALKWAWAMEGSKLDLRPAKYEFGDLPVRPAAVPGKTALI